MSERMTMQMVTAFVLGALLVFTVSFAEEEKTVGQEVVVFDEASNKEIKYCDSTMTEMCECRKGLSNNPENAVPANECVLLNIGLGRARYSALTESITLQLNELAPNLSLYSPSGFKVVAGYAVYGVSREKNTSNVPKHVQITDPSGVITRFLFADGESVATPFAAIGNRTDGRLAMVDAEGWATAADPAYYDFYPGDGSLWRFGASPASADYLRFVFHQTPQGRVETPQDMGVEIIRDADGILRQVMTPAWLADFAVTGLDGYDLRLYPHDASCVPGARSADGAYVIAQGTVPDAVWEFRNPQPGVPRELSVTRKRGDVSETWLYRYEEAVQDFTLVYPQGVMVKRLERVYSDDRTSWTLKRTLTASDGNVVRTEQKHFVAGASGSLLMESVKDPDGLNLVKRYDYYQDPVLNGLLKVSVNDDGSWIRYEYDVQRRKTAEVMPWLDAPTNAPNNQCAVTRYGYGLFTPGDFLAYNDQRPRTEIKEICGVEGSRTYHAYPTNALGQAQEIEERAAFPGATYGHASNPRTVKTYYAASAALPLPGRLATVVHPGGRTETYGYEYGTFNAVTFTFATDPNGGAWRETVTTSYGANSGVQSLRSARVWDEKGREVLDESYVADGETFAVIGWKRMTYDRNGKLIETAYSDGRVESATWGANCCGKESETTAEGIITVYGYNSLKQKISETKKGLAADGSDDITTLYTYDLENRVLSTAITNVASSLGYVASRNAYDAVGRVTNSVDRLGNPTATEYAANRTVTVRLPNGVVSVTGKFGDGRARLVSEDNVVRQAHAYGVTPDGMRWMLSAEGALPGVEAVKTEAELRALASVLDCPWTLVFQDSFGQPAVTMRPGFGRTVLVMSNAYNAAGNLSSNVETSCRPDGTGVESVKSQLYVYAGDGSLLFSALDLNTNGVIDLEGPDRITGTTSAYEKDAAARWWQVSRQWIYPEFNSSAIVTTSVRRVRLTGLGLQQGDDGVQAWYAETLDVSGNATVSATLVDRANRRMTRLAVSPTSAQPAIQTTVNGLLAQTVSSTAVTNTFAYDGLARQISTTDGRGNTSVTAYNALGLIAYTEDAAANRTTYGYDALGRRTSVTDALGNVTRTAYDADNRVIATWGATYPVAYEYDAAGRMTAMHTTRDASLAITNHSSFLLPPSSFDRTIWLYDHATGLLTNKLYADGLGPAYTYTPDGKLATRTWARGITTAYTHDMAGSLVGVDYSDDTPDIAYTYNRIGQTLSANNTASTNSFTYSSDTLELLSETQNGSIITRLTDAQGRPSGLALGDDYAVAYGYDPLGRFSAVQSVLPTNEPMQSRTNAFLYSRLPGSDIISGYTAGPLTVTKTYEPRRDLITQVRNETSGGVVSQYDYANDALGRRDSRHDSGLAFAQSQTNTFGYNARSEVAGAVMHTNTYGYVFDPIGNRLVSSHNAETNTYTANSLNQYSQISASSVVHPTHDLDGNMTFDGREWRYVWNGENRLILASNATHVVSYVYDHRGRMVWKTVALANAQPDKEIKYTWDDYNIIAEHVTINDTTGVTYNVWGLDLSGTLQGDGGVGGLLSVHKDGAIFFPSYDANGNVTEYVSSDGTLVSHRDYSVFGETTNLTGPLTDSFTFWWSTKPWCHLTALCEYEQRMYVQTTGRWISCDPEGDRNIINLYCFVRNSPLTLIDVLGLFMNDPICQKAKEKFKINGNDTGGGVVCDENGVKHVCVYYDGGSEQNPVAKKWVLDCTYVHENQHLVDLPPCKDQPCPQIAEIDFSGTNNAQENLRQSECKAHYLHIRCLETARDVHCGGDQECIKEIEREMERVRSVMSNYWRCTDDGNPGPLYN